MFTYPDLVPDQILSDRGPCTWAGPALTKFWVPFTKPNLVQSMVRQRFGPDQIGFVNGAIVKLSSKGHLH